MRRLVGSTNSRPTDEDFEQGPHGRGTHERRAIDQQTLQVGQQLVELLIGPALLRVLLMRRHLDTIDAADIASRAVAALQVASSE